MGGPGSGRRPGGGLGGNRKAYMRIVKRFQIKTSPLRMASAIRTIRGARKLMANHIRAVRAARRGTKMA